MFSRKRIQNSKFTSHQVGGQISWSDVKKAYDIGSSVYSGFKAQQEFPGEMHVPLVTSSGIKMAQFAGPNTNLQARLARDDTGRTFSDSVARAHDIDYSLAQNASDVRAADDRMIRRLKQAKGIDRVNASVMSVALRGKKLAERVGVPQSAFASTGAAGMDESMLRREQAKAVQTMGGARKKQKGGQAMPVFVGAVASGMSPDATMSRDRGASVATSSVPSGGSGLNPAGGSLKLAGQGLKEEVLAEYGVPKRHDDRRRKGGAFCGGAIKLLECANHNGLPLKGSQKRMMAEEKRMAKKMSGGSLDRKQYIKDFTNAFYRSTNIGKFGVPKAVFATQLANAKKNKMAGAGIGSFFRSIGNAFKSIPGGIKKAANTVGDAFKTSANKTKDFFTADSTKQFGKDFWKGFKMPFGALGVDLEDPKSVAQAAIKVVPMLL